MVMIVVMTDGLGHFDWGVRYGYLRSRDTNGYGAEIPLIRELNDTCVCEQ